MRKLMVIIVASLFFASVAVMAQRPEQPISQGNFAILLASSLNNPAPAGGWNTTSAPAFLMSLNISPISGVWLPSANLKEGDLAHMVRILGLNFYSTQPNAPVTWVKAKSLIMRYQNYFKKINLRAMASDKTTATHIATGVGGTEAAAPASPATP